MSFPQSEAPSAAPADTRLQALVADEQLRLLFSHMVVGTAVATFFGLLLAGYLVDFVGNPTAVLVWVVLKLAIALPRVAHAQLWRLRGKPSDAFWQRSTLALLAVDGACWGLAGAWLADGDSEIVAIAAASLSAVASVATFGLQVRWTATAAYVLPMLLPTALAALARGDRFGAFVGLGLLGYLAVVLATAHRSQGRMAETIRLRFLNDRIAHEKAEALEMVQRQSQVKSRFLAAMSHELRTPLHGILGLTRVSRSQGTDAELDHRLGLIEHSGEHLLQLINDLLDMSRIEAGKVEIHEAHFDLAAELDELVDIYLVRAMEKRLEMRTVLRLPSPCWVRGDATRVRQVLHNLLGNAVKFTQHGHVELRASRGAGARVEFVVADTGPGIAPDDISRIFEPFWQAPPSERMQAGTGLGLNIALEMARAMGGELRCTSELGRGTTFALSLPLPEEERPHAANETNWMLDGDMAPPLRRVLLAEDNEVNALVVRAMLDRAGCKVTVVDNGDDAVALATQADTRPDIVLMDCQMPVMDGLEASRRIRARERALALPHLPIVALTANTSLDDRAACRQAGMDLFLGKPFTERELLQAMAACREASTPF